MTSPRKTFFQVDNDSVSSHPTRYSETRLLTTPSLHQDMYPSSNEGDSSDDEGTIAPAETTSDLVSSSALVHCSTL